MHLVNGAHERAGAQARKQSSKGSKRAEVTKQFWSRHTYFIQERKEARKQLKKQQHQQQNEQTAVPAAC